MQTAIRTKSDGESCVDTENSMLKATRKLLEESALTTTRKTEQSSMLTATRKTEQSSMLTATRKTEQSSMLTATRKTEQSSMLTATRKTEQSSMLTATRKTEQSSMLTATRKTEQSSMLTATRKTEPNSVLTATVLKKVELNSMLNTTRKKEQDSMLTTPRKAGQSSVLTASSLKKLEQNSASTATRKTSSQASQTPLQKRSTSGPESMPEGQSEAMRPPTTESGCVESGTKEELHGAPVAPLPREHDYAKSDIRRKGTRSARTFYVMSFAEWAALEGVGLAMRKPVKDSVAMEMCRPRVAEHLLPKRKYMRRGARKKVKDEGDDQTRRRQSDAKWRASVASCFDILSSVVPCSKKSSPRVVSKVLTLEEVRKHILHLETKLEELIHIKAEHLGKMVMTSSGDGWTPATMDKFRQQFVEDQKEIFSLSGPGRRRYSALSDIEDRIVSMGTDFSRLAVVPAPAKSDLPLLRNILPLSPQLINQHSKPGVPSLEADVPSPPKPAFQCPSRLDGEEPADFEDVLASSPPSPHCSMQTGSPRFVYGLSTPPRPSAPAATFTVPPALARVTKQLMFDAEAERQSVWTLPPVPPTPPSPLLASPSSFSSSSPPQPVPASLSSTPSQVEGEEASGEDSDSSSLLCHETFDFDTTESTPPRQESGVQTTANFKKPLSRAAEASWDKSATICEAKRRRLKGEYHPKCRRSLEKFYEEPASSCGAASALVPDAESEGDFPDRDLASPLDPECSSFDGYLQFYKKMAETLEQVGDGSDSASPVPLVVSKIWAQMSTEDQLTLVKLASTEDPSALEEADLTTGDVASDFVSSGSLSQEEDQTVPISAASTLILPDCHAQTESSIFEDYRTLTKSSTFHDYKSQAESSILKDYKFESESPIYEDYSPQYERSTSALTGGWQDDSLGGMHSHSWPDSDRFDARLNCTTPKAEPDMSHVPSSWAAGSQADHAGAVQELHGQQNGSLRSRDAANICLQQHHNASFPKFPMTSGTFADDNPGGGQNRHLADFGSAHTYLESPTRGLFTFPDCGQKLWSVQESDELNAVCGGKAQEEGTQAERVMNTEDQLVPCVEDSWNFQKILPEWSFPSPEPKASDSFGFVDSEAQGYDSITMEAASDNLDWTSHVVPDVDMYLN